MGNQGEHNIAHLETGLKELGEQLETMGDTSDLKEILFLIHHLERTTQAEYLLVSGIVDAMQEHARALTTLRQALITGSRVIVELNPQPLPPGPPEE